jgi:uncharacterized membrane protein
MTAKHLLSALSVIALVFLFVAALAQQTQPEQQSQSATPSRWGTPFWAEGGPLWFGFHPTGHELTVEEVTDGLQRWIARGGNPRLKPGNVVAKDNRTITAEIVTVDNSLVQKLDIDRRTGMVWQMQRPGGWGTWQHWGPPHWMGWPSQGGSGWPPFPFIGMFLFMIVMGIAAMILVFAVRRSNSEPRWWSGSSPIDELNARYASGEISRDEYLRRKSALPKLSARQ